jgi:hypothetical protein
MSPDCDVPSTQVCPKCDVFPPHKCVLNVPKCDIPST